MSLFSDRNVFIDGWHCLNSIKLVSHFRWSCSCNCDSQPFSCVCRTGFFQLRQHANYPSVADAWGDACFSPGFCLDYCNSLLVSSCWDSTSSPSISTECSSSSHSSDLRCLLLRPHHAGSRDTSLSFNSPKSYFLVGCSCMHNIT